MTYIVIQAIEVEADSPTDAVESGEVLHQFEFPYHVQVANAVTRAAVECAIKGATEVIA